MIGNAVYYLFPVDKNSGDEEYTWFDCENAEPSILTMDVSSILLARLAHLFSDR